MQNEMTQVDEHLEQKKVDAIMTALHDPRATNKPVLQNQIAEMQRMKNGGFPKFMHHERLEPKYVLNETQREGLAAMGYVEHYIPKQYPRYLFRRNLDVKFAESGFVEERLVASKEKEQELRKQRSPSGCSEWEASPADLEALAEESVEDLTTTVARLEGQLAEAHRLADEAASKKK